MLNQEISHKIATVVRGWTQEEGVVYKDKDGNTQYIISYPDSPAHALDLAMEEDIAIFPINGQWKAYKKINAESIEPVMGSEVTDSLFGKAVCFAILKAHGVEM